jgi:hypothetical protein
MINKTHLLIAAGILLVFAVEKGNAQLCLPMSNKDLRSIQINCNEMHKNSE